MPSTLRHVHSAQFLMQHLQSPYLSRWIAYVIYSYSRQYSFSFFFFVMSHAFHLKPWAMLYSYSRQRQGNRPFRLLQVTNLSRLILCDFIRGLVLPRNRLYVLVRPGNCISMTGPTWKLQDFRDTVTKGWRWEKQHALFFQEKRGAATGKFRVHETITRHAGHM